MNTEPTQNTDITLCTRPTEKLSCVTELETEEESKETI